jgi:lysozyme family protein
MTIAMAKNTYPAALKETLKWEGGYVNHPADPGGPTNFGVTQRVYDGYRGGKGLPKQSVRYIGQGEVQAIYGQLYADKIRFDDLPAGIDLAVFDAAVNSGPGQAAKWLQRALGVKVDGVIGPATILAASTAPNKLAIIRGVCDLRLAFMRRLKTFETFGRGWVRRVEAIRASSLAMAGAPKLELADTLADPNGGARATLDQAAPRPSKKVADAATGGGVATGTIAGSLAQAQAQLEPVAGSSEVVNIIIAVLAVASAMLVIGGLGWRWWKTREAEEYAADLDIPAQVTT